MKFSLTLMATGALVLVLLCSGCTSTTQQAPSQTTSPTPVITPATTAPALVPAAAAYPDALAVGQYATFGSGTKEGKATVYRYAINPTYNWTEPTFNSAHNQLAASGPNGIQHGYITEKPGDGDTFLFVYVRVIDTGTTEMYVPSPSQFVVVNGGTAYNYTSVRSSDVVIDNVFENQYDFRLGTTGVVGEIKPGDSNAAEGYLIYEVPQSISAQDTYVVVNLDYQTRAVWRLA
jgi:hypothetical protein